MENEVTKMSFSGDPQVYVVKTDTLRVCHLQPHNTQATTPLAWIYTEVDRHARSATPILMPKTLCNVVNFLGNNLGLLQGSMSARLLHVAGVMALLRCKVDPDISHVLGQWHLEETFR